MRVQQFAVHLKDPDTVADSNEILFADVGRQHD